MTAPVRESAVNQERAVWRESTNHGERAVIFESAVARERAVRAECADNSERAVTRESTACRERAEIDESTEIGERAELIESAVQGERAVSEESAKKAELCRRYADWEQTDSNGYPLAWQTIKVLVREEAGNRCLRCRHPYTRGEGEWSACDSLCTHGKPTRIVVAVSVESTQGEERAAEVEGTVIEKRAVMSERTEDAERIEAQWRILTTHHLDGDKRNMQWWNLVPLCQRCHLTIQGKVRLDRVWPYEHSEWFKPYAAAWYALKYLGAELGRIEVMSRLEELLALELTHDKLPGAAW